MSRRAGAAQRMGQRPRASLLGTGGLQAAVAAVEPRRTLHAVEPWAGDEFGA
jgi:hypothetical protein